jgi:hypothetical protein
VESRNVREDIASEALENDKRRAIALPARGARYEESE